MTTCYGNSSAAQCAVHAVTWENAGLSADDVKSVEDALDFELSTDIVPGAEVLVRGSFQSDVDFVVFQPKEVWLAQDPNGTSINGTKSGTFVQVFATHDECIKAPCPQYLEAKLNSTRTDSLDGLDFGNNSGEDTYVGAVDAQADTQQGVIVVGEYETQSENKLRTVDQSYFPIGGAAGAGH
jgi:hypothetical protein